ncbi:hypothetical protein ABZV29_19995 [Streptomyces sp. NPDC005236]|uniref:hypothetical protein n=1 Tax=Streptomyces sp. NPDC005236 TaxID=3157028 RepID=UPI0033AC11A7
MTIDAVGARRNDPRRAATCFRFEVAAGNRAVVSVLQVGAWATQLGVPQGPRCH